MSSSNDGFQKESYSLDFKLMTGMSIIRVQNTFRTIVEIGADKAFMSNAIDGLLRCQYIWCDDTQYRTFLDVCTDSIATITHNPIMPDTNSWYHFASMVFNINCPYSLIFEHRICYRDSDLIDTPF